MKFLLNLLTILSFIFIASCDQPKSLGPTPENPTGNVTINVLNEANGIPITSGGYKYTNSSYNLYSVDILRYYISNVILIKNDGSEFKLNNYDLIDAFDAKFSNIIASSIPNGTYTSMKFSLGVDNSRNHTGAQDGDLDPSNGMIWDWNTGYIFFKHEGNFKDGSNNDHSLTFHLGTDKAYSTAQIPISLLVEGTNKTMNIVFDLNKMYNSPPIEFNEDNNHTSSSALDDNWISKMVANSNDAFTFKNVE